MYYYGHILNRNRRDKNEIILYEDYAEIVLYDKDNNEFNRAFIDLEDVEKCKDIKWRCDNKNLYVQANVIGRLHNYVMNFKPPKDKSKVVNHKDRNRLDCRKKNLEITTYQENGINKGKQSNNTSGYVGVSWNEERSKWESNIKLNRTKYHLGYFTDIKDAVKARLDGELKYFGRHVNRENDKYTVFKNQTFI
jgi:hypothetical protein